LESVPANGANAKQHTLLALQRKQPFRLLGALLGFKIAASRGLVLFSFDVELVMFCMASDFACLFWLKCPQKWGIDKPSTTSRRSDHCKLGRSWTLIESLFSEAEIRGSYLSRDELERVRTRCRVGKSGVSR